ncbi:YdhK family protein [Ureibacillus chungkukjangi]|uniref:YdhK family protein n=1 Tax=Ureibacillus chungkukjangi TaxID=1202712 RepID=UPI00203E949D|nr:YdhK family protein [Ureibacillus chungkukjangi]
MSKFSFVIIVLAIVLNLSACGDNEDAAHDMSQDDNEETTNMDHSTMKHLSDGKLPEGLKEASYPTYSVGSTAIIQANHMEGMNNAEATIVGAYDTTVYAVSYTPSNGGEPVTNHKWVIHEELKGAGEDPLKPGDQATINADHMHGMQGATGTIDSAIETTVYMVDYISTTGEKVTNHKWVTESELSKTKE